MNITCNKSFDRILGLFFFISWLLDHNKKIIAKDVFEHTGENFLEVQDWGSVDAGLKQIMYSVVYSACVQVIFYFFFNFFIFIFFYFLCFCVFVWRFIYIISGN
jgi:hypothetical protein